MQNEFSDYTTNKFTMGEKFLVCNSCGSINKIPENKLKNKPHCGACKNLLFTGTPLDVGSNLFHKHVSKTTIPIVVNFWASWCSFCKKLSPVFGEVTSKMEPYIRFVKVNSDQEQTISNQYQIKGLPTLIIFTNGKEKVRTSGAMAAHELYTWISSNVK